MISHGAPRQADTPAACSNARFTAVRAICTEYAFWVIGVAAASAASLLTPDRCVR